MWNILSETEHLLPTIASGNWDGLKSDQLFVKDKFGNAHVAVAYKGVIDGVAFCCFYDDRDFEIEHITHWMLIPE